jgi:hypothetical protein
MTIALAQSKGTLIDNSATTISLAFDSSVQAGSLIVISCVAWQDNALTYTAGSCTQTAGTATLSSIALDYDRTVATSGSMPAAIWSAIVTGAGTLTLRVAGHTANCWMDLTIAEYTGSWDSSRVETTNEANGTATPANSGSVTSAGAALMFAALAFDTTVNQTITEGNSFTALYEVTDGTTHMVGGSYHRLVTSGTTTSFDATFSSSPISAWSAGVVVYREANPILQDSYNVDDTGSTATTIATTITGVTAGSALVAFVGGGDTSGTITCTVSDGTSYTIAGAKNYYAVASQSSWVFVLPNAGAGSHTVTATFSTTTPYRRIRVLEVSGLDTTAPIDQATQTSDDTSPYSSGVSSATTNANDVVLGFYQNAYELPATTRVAGTGYTLYGTNYMMAVEWGLVSATGTQEATFTGNSGGSTLHVVALKKASGASSYKVPLLMYQYRLRRK